MDKMFGTDGVRGPVNDGVMSAESILKLGAAVGRMFRRDRSGAHRVVIGKDTRLSGYMFENALTAGLTSTGMNVLLLGPIPTPAVGLLTVSMRADLGVMISASHNPASDNGIKFFGPDGYKLSDEAQLEIEALYHAGVTPAQAMNVGRAKHIYEGRFRYNERLKASLPSQSRFDGLKVVVDCANGAAYRTAPEVLWELGADVVTIGTSPDGSNINLDCGSTHPQAAAAAVVAHQADVGLCLDGDADRIILVDENGAIADGDQIMALLARRLDGEQRLHKRTLVSTVMSNLGLERGLAKDGIALHRTDVGDRYIVEAMRAHGFSLGGEQSGHIIMADHATTGDGLLSALHFLAEMRLQERRASELLRQFEPVPQLLKNVPIKGETHALEHASVKKVIADAEQTLGCRGRLLIRASGTEPLIRVMGECEDLTLLNDVMECVVTEITNAP